MKMMTGEIYYVINVSGYIKKKRGNINMNFKGKLVGVTGAGGFVGSHLVEALVERGAKVRALVHYNGRNSWGHLDDIDKEIMENVEVIAGDILDYSSMFGFCNDTDVLFHLAALTSIPFSYRVPFLFEQVNTRGTMNVLNGCLGNFPSRAIIISSDEVYGDPEYIPMDEKHPLRPKSPYAASKVGAEAMAMAFYHAYDLPVSIIRPSNIFGERQSTKGVIPTIIAQALLGNEIKLGNIEPIRDWTYVKDTVNGFIKVAEKGLAGRVYNIGYGNGNRVIDIVYMVEDILNKRLTVSQDESRMRPNKSEIMELVATSERARAELNWRPVNNIRGGLIKTIEYMGNNLDSYREGYQV